jgi:hypothetical protein
VHAGSARVRLTGSIAPIDEAYWMTRRLAWSRKVHGRADRLHRAGDAVVVPGGADLARARSGCADGTARPAGSTISTTGTIAGHFRFVEKPKS